MLRSRQCLHLLAMLMLAACTSSGPEKRDISGTAPELPPAAAASLTPIPPPEPEPPDLSVFYGLEPAAVHAILGTPGLIRREQGMQLHQFLDAACVLDIAFYSEKPGDPFIARHIETRDRSGEAVASRDFLARLVPRSFRVMPVP